MRWLRSFSFLFFYLFLSPARAIITLDKPSCQAHDVQEWIDDAIVLSQTAAANLNEALKIADGDISRLPPQVAKILRAFLGTNVDINTYELAATMIGQIAASRDNDVDIEITCKDRSIQCPSPLEDLCYPVKLERIEASLPRAFPDPKVQASFSKSGLFLTQIGPPGNENLAHTVTSTPSHGFQEPFLYQQQCTASNHEWSDITVTKAYTDYNGIATLQDWLLHHKGSSWADQSLFAPGPLIDSPLASSLVILHELMHSVALQTPAWSHTEIYSRDANSLRDVVEAGNGGFDGVNGQIPIINNPAALVWLIVSMSMPWIELFHTQSNGYYVGDAQLKWNKNDNNHVWIPGNYQQAQGRDLTLEELKVLMEEGPYA